MRVNVCATCGVEFTKPKNPQRVYRFCSLACSGANPEKRAAHSESMKGRNLMGEDRSCRECGATFYAARFRLERGEGKYCSRACTAVATGKTRVGTAPPNKGVSMSPEQREKLSRAKTGKTGPLCNAWKGGTTIEGTRIRSSKTYREWRTAVFTRDDYTCQVCGQRGGSLQADHIQRFADFPELRFDLDNGRTLCAPCHRKTPTFGNRRLVEA